MENFVQLDRRFLPFDSTQVLPGNRSEWLSRFWQRQGGLTWEELLTKKCSIILGEGGTGKTYELKNQAAALRRSGAPAFLCRIEMLAQNAFEHCLGPDDRQIYESWKLGDQSGYFFLDSIDESRLRSHGQFHQALINFANAISDHISRATVVLSTRPYAWFGQSDRDMLRDRLGLGSIEKHGNALHDDPQNTDRDTSVEIFTIAPLNAAQIRRYCEAQGLEKVDDFIEALSQNDIGLLAERPADLSGLVSKWEKDGRLGRYSEVVDHVVSKKLTEQNPFHSQQSTLDSTKAMHGAELLAAAVTLSQTEAIGIPGHEYLNSSATEHFEATEVLPRWPPPQVTELLGRSIFDEAIFNTVRFCHRTIREYVAAHWILHLLKEGKSRRTIEDLFIRTSYGFDRPLIPSPLKPLAGWLSLWDEQFGRKIIESDPRILLQFGDPSSLDFDIRISLLKQLADRFAGRSYAVVSLDRYEIKRLAHPALGSTINALLTERSHEHDLCVLLVQLVTEGKIEECNKTITDLAYTSDDLYIRSLSIEALAATGDANARRTFVKFVLENVASIDRQIIGTTISHFWPTDLSDQELVSLLSSCRAPAPDTFDSFEYSIGSIPEKIDEPNRLESLLSEIVKLVSTPPWDGSGTARIGRRYTWLIRGMWGLASRYCQLHPDPYRNATVLTAITLAESCNHIEAYTGDVHEQAVGLISSNRSLRHALIWHQADMARKDTGNRITDIIDIPILHMLPLSVDDLNPLIMVIQQPYHPDDADIATTALHRIYVRSGRDRILRTRIMRHLASNDRLLQKFKVLSRPVAQSAAAKKANRSLKDHEAHMKARRDQHAASRDAAIRTIRENPEKIADPPGTPPGQVSSTVAFLYRETREPNSSGTSWTQSQWEKLIPEFGETVASRYRDYCMGYWRRYQPTARSDPDFDHSGTPWGVLIGLSGIAMEARGNKNWARQLSPEEAKRATLFATLELNGFPAWLTDVATARPPEASEMLLQEIEWELQADSNKSSTIMYHVLRRAPGLRLVPSNKIQALLEAHSQRSSPALHDALSYILTEPDVASHTLAEVAEIADASSKDGELAALWLAVLTSINPSMGLPKLHHWLEKAPSLASRETRLTDFLLTIWGDGQTAVKGLSENWRSAQDLLAVIKLTYQIIRPTDDIHHRGVYRPTDRDHAQSIRGSLISILAQIPGAATVDALMSLSSWTSEEYVRDKAISLAEDRALEDIQFRKWEPSAVAEFATELELASLTQNDLFRIACSRIDDLKLSLEQGDDSVATLWQKAKDEMELRRAIATELRRDARGRYTIGSEEELADRTRTDLRLHNPSVGIPVVIEIKIAGQYTADDLRDMIKSQLIDRYMKVSNFGLYLIVNRQGQNDQRSWTIETKRNRDFMSLIEWLSSEAAIACAKCSANHHIRVVGLDLTARTSKSQMQRPKKQNGATKVRPRRSGEFSP